MSNNYFSFKQFTIQQQHCAMKVCTDACLFGAWVAGRITENRLAAQRILDIGAGTGLLSLMLAQQCGGSFIHAVEIDPAAARQAGDNFAASPWRQRLSVFNTAVQHFVSPVQYDFLITNPPFFQNDLESKDAGRNTALHSEHLDLQQLLIVIEKHLSADGRFAILLPYHRTAYFEEMARKRCFYVQEKTMVQQTPAHVAFRAMLLLGRKEVVMMQDSITIKTTEGSYTETFMQLLKPYYLYL